MVAFNVHSLEKVSALVQTKEEGKECKLLIHRQETTEVLHQWFVYIFLCQLGSLVNT